LAHRPPMIAFEDVPLGEARQMSRRPRMDPEFYSILKQKTQSLDNIATRMLLPEGANPTTMKKRIIHLAAERGIPVTIQRVPGGLLFCRSTDEDLQQPQEVAERLQSARQPQQAARAGRRLRA
jgi:hypothetical protein